MSVLSLATRSVTSGGVFNQQAFRGLISQYNGTREPGRYAKYVKYGFDLSLVKPDLVEGFYASAVYWRNRGDDDHIKLAEIYEIIAAKIEFDEIDELNVVGNKVSFIRPTDDEDDDADVTELVFSSPAEAQACREGIEDAEGMQAPLIVESDDPGYDRLAACEAARAVQGS